MCLYDMDGEVYIKLEAVTNFLLRLQAFDDMIQALPWEVKDQKHHNPPIAITSIS